jgi:hypothetical protein
VLTNQTCEHIHGLYKSLMDGFSLKLFFFTIWKKIDEKKSQVQFKKKKTQQTHFGFIIVFLNKNKIGKIRRQK